MQEQLFELVRSLESVEACLTAMSRAEGLSPLKRGKPMQEQLFELVRSLESVKDGLTAMRRAEGLSPVKGATLICYANVIGYLATKLNSIAATL